MSDENGAALFNPTEGDAGSGNPEPSTEQTPSPPVEGQGEEGQAQFVTEDALNQRLDDLMRKVQSSRDSALTTFDKRIKSSIEAVEKDIEHWRKQGVKITPEQEQQRRVAAMQEAMMQSDTGGLVGQQVQPGVPNENAIKQVNARASAMSQQAGVELEQDDPELLLLDQSTPDAFLASFRNALYQKKIRTAGTNPPPEARIPSMGQATKAPAGADEAFLKEYKSAQGQGLAYARSIRDKYKKQGVNVEAVIAENF